MTAVTVPGAGHHVEDPDVVGRRWRTGVILLIVADAAFVASMVFSYFYLRGLNTERAWLAAGQPTAAIWVSWALAGGAIISAGLYRFGLLGIRKGQASQLLTGVSLALLVLLADAVGQVIQLVTFPFGAADSAYSSCVYLLAGASLFHLLLTAFLGIGMWNRSRLGRFTVSTHWQAHVTGIWWTWIAVAAVVSAFTTSFIASPNGS